MTRLHVSRTGVYGIAIFTSGTQFPPMSVTFVLNAQSPGAGQTQWMTPSAHPSVRLKRRRIPSVM